MSDKYTSPYEVFGDRAASRGWPQDLLQLADADDLFFMHCHDPGDHDVTVELMREEIALRDNPA